MGLTHPADLRAWHRWQARRNLPRTLKTAAARGVRRIRRIPEPQPRFALHVRGEAPELLVALETTGPTQRAALLEPLTHLPERDLAVLAPHEVTEHLPGGPWRTRELTGQQLGQAPELRSVRRVLGVGSYLPVGAAADAWREQRDLPFWVVQHGLLVPMAPPLPRAAHLLAFSAADAAYWTAGRPDTTAEVVGSQLLWRAGAAPRGPAEAVEAAPVFLGQLHGAELPRIGLIRSCYAFCRKQGAVYRPHPGERDLLSRLVHRWWRRRGIAFDDAGQPLTRLRSPVVSVFSTGVLEAAALGLPAWVHHRRPPAWLRELWGRYGMRPWGGPPTPAPDRPDVEPARRIAQILTEDRHPSAPHTIAQQQEEEPTP